MNEKLFSKQSDLYMSYLPFTALITIIINGLVWIWHTEQQEGRECFS